MSAKTGCLRQWLWWTPHRKDDGYPHRDLSGVGVAFKLAAALAGDQETVLREYADLVCLGTVADVMPLRGRTVRL